MDQTGLNLIRAMIGSYFCGAALGLPVGFDPGFLFSFIWAPALAAAIGTTVMLALAITFVCGVWLRPVTLMLVAFFVLTSVASWVFEASTDQTASLWQTCAFGAAILLCYAPLKPHEMHKAALFSTVLMRGNAARVWQADVSPRRVSARDIKAKRTHRDVRSLRALIAPTEQMIGMAKSDLEAEGQAATRRPKPFPVVEDDLENIFVNL